LRMEFLGEIGGAGIHRLGRMNEPSVTFG